MVGGSSTLLSGLRPSPLPRGNAFAMQCCAGKGCRVSKRGQEIKWKKMQCVDGVMAWFVPTV